MGSASSNKLGGRAGQVIARIPARAILAQATAGVARIGSELRRRGALVRQPQPDGVGQPPLRLLFGEFGTFLELRRVRKQLGNSLPVSPVRRRSVMLIPGLATHPVRMGWMRRGLEAAGHRVCDWGLGFNFGPTPENFEDLCRAIAERAERDGEPLALIGWSLGGLFAREAAKRHPWAVDLVVTMGTPFSGDFHANRGWRAYQCITGHEVTATPVAGDFAAKPPVRTVALWSPRDGLIGCRAARGRPGERDEAIAVRCTHVGFPRHPLALAEVLRQLDRQGD